MATEERSFFGFIDEVEFLWRLAGKEASGPQDDSDSPVAIWIEVDCIDDAHVVETVAAERVPRLAPGASLARALVREREALIDQLVDEEVNLGTLYLTAGPARDAFRDWQERLAPSTWIRLSVTIGEREIDISAPGSIPSLSDQEMVLFARDPYTGKARICERWDIEPVTLELSSTLEEIFSLNHLPDIDTPGDEGEGGTGGGGIHPLDPDFPGHLFNEGLQGHMCFDIDYGLKDCTIFDSSYDGRLDVFFDTRSDSWYFVRDGVRFESRSVLGGTVWIAQSDPEPYVLLDIAGRIVVVRESALEENTYRVHQEVHRRIRLRYNPPE